MINLKQRPLQFRAWDQFNMVFYYSIHYSNLAAFFAEMQKLIDVGNNLVIQQFTGMHDQANNPIYEGCILDIAYEHNGNIHTGDEGDCGCYRGVVKYTPSVGFGLNSVTKRSDVEGSVEWNQNLNRIKQSAATVIGNIFENPELIEDK